MIPRAEGVEHSSPLDPTERAAPVHRPAGELLGVAPAPRPFAGAVRRRELDFRSWAGVSASIMGRLPSSTTVNRRTVRARFSDMSLVGRNGLHSAGRRLQSSGGHPGSGVRLDNQDESC